MKKTKFLVLFLLLGCVGEDIVSDEVDPVVQLVNPLSNLQIGDSFQFQIMFLNDVGLPVTPTSVTWMALDESIVTVDESGLVSGIQDGTAEISIHAVAENLEAETDVTFSVSNEPTTLLILERLGTIQSTSSYILAGDFSLKATGSDLMLDLANDYQADTGLPGLYVYLSNNPNTTNGAYEIGPVTIFSGAHSYTIPDTELYDYNYVLYYCKPFNVKVGHGLIN